MTKPKGLDLNFLFQAYPAGYKKWTDEKITELIELIQAGTTDYAKLAKHFGVKESSVKNIVSELKRAANQGIRLESYLAKGRQLRTGKKVLA